MKQLIELLAFITICLIKMLMLVGLIIISLYVALIKAKRYVFNRSIHRLQSTR
jgi:hypothetical protein